MDIATLYQTALGHDPYPWQQEIAESGLPETIQIETGCGKTAAVILGWIYRRRHHPDAAVRAATPRRLVFVLPMRTLVEQIAVQLEGWLTKLERAEPVGPEGKIITGKLMGGEPASDVWRMNLHCDAILVGTLDMILSRTLNRGFAANRYSWPIDFGLLNNDCHYVFDEVQLMGVAGATSRQLQAFRESIGSAGPTRSTWMSATLDLEPLRTVDAPEIAEPFTMPTETQPPALTDRLFARRQILPWLDHPVDPKRLIAERARAINDGHFPGKLTLAIVNTVDSARKLHAEVLKLKPEAELVLLHSRFRPGDRSRQLNLAIGKPSLHGLIVISTQVVEAGVDISATTLFTESAPWSSIVQRVGRCNRTGVDNGADGEAPLARVFWDPSVGSPYEEGDIAFAEAAMEELNGSVVTTRSLSEISVAESEPAGVLVLRRRDLLRLFDTAPDLAGNDLDVGPYLRSGDDLDAQLCWRNLGDAEDVLTPPTRSELCSVPLGDLRKWVVGRTVLRLDSLDAGPGRRAGKQWVPVDLNKLRPGQILLADSKGGGYTPAVGWNPVSKVPVADIAPQPGDPDSDPFGPLDEQFGSDPASRLVGAEARTVVLAQHLTDVDAEIGSLLEHLGLLDLPTTAAASAQVAGRWHDLGKAHGVFQGSMRKAAGIAEDDGRLLAKSGSNGPLRHSRRYFRHELASAMALLGEAGSLLPSDVDRDLVLYLVAAHHGRVRMSIRSLPDEDPAPKGTAPDARHALGIWEGDQLPGFEVDGQSVPAATLSLASMELGDGSWTEMASRLRDRPDLGPFRLAYLEAIVRLADWRVSKSYDYAEVL